MTPDTRKLHDLAENTPDADLLREMIGLAAERRIEPSLPRPNAGRHRSIWWRGLTSIQTGYGSGVIRSGKAQGWCVIQPTTFPKLGNRWRR
ncbi:hypothetical protein [Rhodobacter ferrooxidans]|uniref:hypothetical protein n=1 Tax=Rhodobacter ferrooxidans TaxID=371731 RepID=UPI000594B186|nr:hypothetical protein [Rhodobacter sp. SW2]